ncbi:MAG: hypothetical protein SPG06_02110 [Eubacteriales bacterium]|nr:hypothetical protein [Eubacteriales bacterium]
MTFESFLKSIYNMVYSNMHKFIEVDYTVIYALAFLLIIAWAIVVLISKSFCYTTMISKDCRKINRFIKKYKEINKENVEYFTVKCFGKHCVKSMRNCWKAYLNEGYGFPSEYITYAQCLTRHRVGRGISRSRILAFRYGSGFIALAALGYNLHYINNFSQPIRIVPGLALLAVTAIICDFIINGVFSLADNGAVENFFRMQERLDAYVNLYQDFDVEDYAEVAETSEETIVENTERVETTQEVSENVVIDEKEPENEDTVSEVVEDTKIEPIETVEETAEPVADNVVVDEVTTESEETLVAADTTNDDEEMKPETKEKLEKISALVDVAISKKANRATYIGLAKMLIEASSRCENSVEKARLKECALKIKRQIV